MNSQKDPLMPLSSFQTSQPTQIFKTCTSQPQFLKTHLQDPHRLIKILKDDANAIERIFYYQYLKLCSIQNGYPQIRRENLRIVINSPQFVYKFPSDCHQSNPLFYTDKQFKSLALQFIELLQVNTGKLDEILSKYPIMDLVMTYLMRSLLIISQIVQYNEQFVQKTNVLNVLCKIFDVEWQSFGGCVKFVQSDVFILEQSPFQVYMIYLDNNKQQKQESIPKLTTKKSKKQKNQMYKSSVSNQCYQFVDYTGLQVQNLQKGSLSQKQNLSYSHQEYKLPAMGHIKQQKNNLFETFREERNEQSSNDCANNSQNQIQFFCNQSEAEEEVMIFDENMGQLETNNKMENNKKLQNKKQQMLDYESDEDQPKFKILILSSKLQKNERASSTEVDTQNNEKSSRDSVDKSKPIDQEKLSMKQETISDNPQQQRQFSFKNQKMQTKLNFKTQYQTQSPIKNLSYLDSKLEYQSGLNNTGFRAYNKNYGIPTYTASSSAANSSFYWYINKQDFPSSKYDLGLQYTVKKSIPSYKDIIEKQSYCRPTPPQQQSKAWEYQPKSTFNPAKNQYSSTYGSYGSSYGLLYSSPCPVTPIIPNYTPQIRLNVTKQFTNSLIMKHMPEINSEGVRRAREKARAYRKTLTGKNI